MPIEALFPGIGRHHVTAPRALDRSVEVSASVLEAIVLGAIAQEIQPRRILEIGTFDGHTALVLSRNAPEDTMVVTVDLPPDSDGSTRLEVPAHMANMTNRHGVGRQFRDSHDATRIRQVYGDSAELDWTALGGPFDLVFIDGCHAEAYVRSDTANALSVLDPRGVLVWHDYGTIEDVSKVVDSFSDVLDINAVLSTSLAVGRYRRGR